MQKDPTTQKQPPPYMAKPENFGPHEVTQEQRRDGWAPFLQLPNRVAIYGASGSGKTTFLLREILTRPAPPFDFVLWVAPGYSLQQTEIKHMSDLGHLMSTDGTEVAFKSLAADAKDWPKRAEELLLKGKGLGYRSCVVLDDCLAKRGAEKAFIVGLYTAGRHLGVDLLIEMSQRIFSGADARTTRLNCAHHIVGRLGGPSEFVMLARQLYTDKETRDKLIRVYQQLCEEEDHPFLWLDTSRHTKDNKDLAFRTGWATCIDLP